MNGKFRAVCFDLGETLLFYQGVPLNWASLYNEALRAVAARSGASPKAEEMAVAQKILEHYNTRLTPRTNEVRAEEILGPILSSWGLRAPDFLDNAIEEFFKFFRQHLTAYPETISVLGSLRQRGIPIGVLTDVPYGMPRKFVERDLMDGGIFGLVNVLLTSVDVGARKPEPAGYAALASRLKVAPDEMLYVGNEPKDVTGALRAGMSAALVDRDGKGGNYGQQFTIADLNPLLEIVPG